MSFENITFTLKSIRYFVKIKLIALTRSADPLLCWIKDEFWHWNNVTLSTLLQISYAAIFQRWFNVARCCLTLFQHCFNVRMPAVSSVFDGKTITRQDLYWANPWLLLCCLTQPHETLNKPSRVLVFRFYCRLFVKYTFKRVWHASAPNVWFQLTIIYNLKSYRDL